jgi:5-methylthioadenosine/S-adenosylhomocysteine deaminase
LIKESGSSIAHCPKSNAKFGHRAAPFELFLDENLRVGLGSDSVASNNTCDLFEEGRNAALTARTRKDKKRLVTAREILQTMTIGGARAMQMETLTGSLEPGKQADLAILSLDNPAQQPVSDIYASVVFASSARDVLATYVAGRAVYENGRSVLADDEQILRKAQETGRKLRGLKT